VERFTTLVSFSPQCAQSSLPSALKLITVPGSTGAKAPAKVAPGTSEGSKPKLSPEAAKRKNRSTLSKAIFRQSSNSILALSSSSFRNKRPLSQNGNQPDSATSATHYI